jgi:repressor LexA
MLFTLEGIMGGIRKKNPEIMKKIYDFVEQYYLLHKLSPSLQRIADEVGIGKGTVYKYLVEMDEKGMISYDGKSIRTKGMSKSRNASNLVPILGSVVCGTPELAEENFDEYVSLPETIFGKGDFFILRTYGDSMIHAGINDDDFVVVERRNTANSGDMVVALVENETTLKTLLFDKNGKIILHPENKNMPDIHPNECYIQGVARHIIKAV